MRVNRIFIKRSIAIVFSAFASVSYAQNGDSDYPNKESLLMDVILQSLHFNHYSELELNDEYSAKVYDTYLDRIDNGKRFFLQEDVDAFGLDRSNLDDFAQTRDFTFFDKVTDVHKQRIEQARAYYKEILTSPFDFTKNESIETDAEKLGFAKDAEELKSRWYKMLKYRVMLDVETKLKRQEDQTKEENTAEEKVEIKSLEELEIEARAKVEEDMDRYFKALDQEDRDDKLSIYLNTFANVVEPHTGYFPPLDKENFDIQMSGQLEGIGAQLTEKDGYTKVARIVPGSASARQGELEVNDLIVKVAQGDEEPVDIVDMKMDDVLPLIRGKKGTEARLTVKKTDGSYKVISIIRDVVVLEESYAKSAIIQDENSKTRVGMIDLRSFYADFNNPKGRRCSRDVKAEVEKLIKENVDGIVIDLRFNGGGSLFDVVEMTGMFIDKGPVVQVKTRVEAPTTLDDEVRGILYDGPLVIMVNSYSASASEIMAAALQDYGRAIIVGSAPSTFGKGTVQRFFELDNAVPAEYNSFGELGSIKITTQKFFRVNGGSTQLKGVVPDIILPGAYSYLETGEKEEIFPMSWSEIERAEYAATTLPKLDKIKAKSEKRVATDETFKLIDEQGKWFKELQEDSEVSLNLEKYRAEQSAFDEKSDRFDTIEKEIEGMKISMTEEDAKLLKDDKDRMESMETWHKALKKDPYVMEVIQIIGDM